MCRPRLSIRPAVALVSVAKLVSRLIFRKFGIKVYPIAGNEGPEGEQLYNCTLLQLRH